jgi:hypothetical protein
LTTAAPLAKQMLPLLASQLTVPSLTKLTALKVLDGVPETSSTSPATIGFGAVLPGTKLPLDQLWSTAAAGRLHKARTAAAITLGLNMVSPCAGQNRQGVVNGSFIR